MKKGTYREKVTDEKIDPDALIDLLEGKDSQVLRYEHFGQLFQKGLSQEYLTAEVDEIVPPTAESSITQFPSLPDLAVLLTVERIFNHEPIDPRQFTCESGYEQALLRWFYSLPQRGCACAIEAIELFLLPELQWLNIGAKSHNGATFSYNKLTPDEVIKALEYLKSVVARVDSDLANLVYGITWKKKGIGQHPLFAMASATMADKATGSSWIGLELLQSLFCHLVLSFERYWAVNQRETSALANATRLSIALSRQKISHEAQLALQESLALAGGWSQLSQRGFSALLTRLQGDPRTASLFPSSYEDVNVSPLATYLESALKVLAAHPIIERQRHRGEGGGGGRKTPVPTEPPCEPTADEDESWVEFLPGEDEPVEGEDDGAERFRPNTRGAEDPDDSDNPDRADSPNHYLGLEIPVKTRAKTIAELQAQAIACTYKLQAMERGGREHGCDMQVLAPGELELLWNEVFVRSSPAVVVAAGGHLKEIAWVVLLSLFFGLSESAIASIRVVKSKDVKRVRAHYDGLRSIKKNRKTKENGSAQNTIEPLSMADFPAPFFEDLLNRKGAVGEHMRLHLPIFDPDHHQGKSSNITWLSYTITPPQGVVPLLQTGQTQVDDNPPILAKAISKTKAVFAAINAHRQTSITLARLSKPFVRFVCLHLPEGATAAKYLFGNLTPGGECSMIYTRYSTEQLQDILQRGIDGFFAHNPWLLRHSLAIDLMVYRDQRTQRVEQAGSSRVPDDDQVKALVSHCQRALIDAMKDSDGKITGEVMQAWSDYLLVWYVCTTGERANDNALATYYMIDEITGWVFCYSKTDNRCTGSTCFYVTPRWLAEATKFIKQSRLMRLIYTAKSPEPASNWVDGERPIVARDMEEFDRVLFGKAPLWLNWPLLMRTGKVVHVSVAHQLRWLWTQANPESKNLGRFLGNESRHYFATKAREAGVQNEAITAWMSHWVNGQSPYRSTASYRKDTVQFESMLAFQQTLEKSLGFLSTDTPLGFEQADSFPSAEYPQATTHSDSEFNDIAEDSK